MARKKTVQLDTSKVGGFAFFLSFLVVIPLALLGIAFLTSTLPTAPLEPLARFGFGAIGGAVAARLLIRGHTAVFVHEFKHSVIANLVGNKATGWRIRKRTGHFEYEFTDKTAGYNAFISLAPYWLPPFTIAALGIALAGWHGAPNTMAILVGLGWGADTLLNISDIGPHQTDFSSIRGGFTVGFLYVLALNTVILVLLLAWVMGGLGGLKLLVKSLSNVLYALII